MAIIIINLGTPKAAAMHELMFNKLASEDGFRPCKSDLSSTIKCDQNRIYDFEFFFIPEAGAKHELLLNKLALAFCTKEQHDKKLIKNILQISWVPIH
jgi:hypothetical protein